MKHLPDFLDSSWGVTVAPDVQRYLERLAESRPDEWRQVVSTIYGLQTEPRPAQARLADANEAEIDSDSTAVSYTIDSAAQQVYVLKISERPGTAADA